MSTSSSSPSSAPKRRAPGKEPMIEPKHPRRMETRSVTSKKRALGGESSSHPTASVPVEPVPTPEVGEKDADLLAEVKDLRETVNYQRRMIWDLRREVSHLQATMREEDKAREELGREVNEQRERIEWLQGITLELSHRVHAMENPPPAPAPLAPEEEPEDEDPDEDPEEDPAEEAGNEGEDSGDDGGDVVD